MPAQAATGAVEQENQQRALLILLLPLLIPPSARQTLAPCLLGQLRAARRLSAMQWLYTKARSAEQKRH